MGKANDEQLFRRLVNGDREALRPLMERHADSLKLYIDGYVRDFDMAEDIMIDAFSRMLVKAPRLHEGAFKPYLYKTARNLALKHIKYRSRFTSLDALTYEPVEGQQLEEGLLADERSRELYRNLDKIPADYREALFLVYIEDLTYDEAGAVMRKSRKQVENLVFRGKRAMKDLMEDDKHATSASAMGAAPSMGPASVPMAGPGAPSAVLGGDGGC